MKNLLSYLIQLGGLTAGVVGLVLTVNHPLIAGLLVGGALAWFVGGYIRRKGLLGS
jgi:hypothetical protein